MVRTQVQLTPEQHRELKRWSSRMGISMSEAVRRCVADGLIAMQNEASGPGRVRAALDVAGRYASGRSDVAEKHDEHLTDAYGA